jgi:phosphomannomutase
MIDIIQFGTDGWRGEIASNYTFANVRRCTQGFSEYLLKIGCRNEWVVVGYDKRFLSENFAKVVAEVLVGNGLKVYLTQDATPTPVISFSVVERQAVGAVNITASHNPATDNGFKVRNEFGGAIPPDGLKEIESLIPNDLEQIKSVSFDEAIISGDIVLFDAAPKYIDQIHSLIDLEPIKKAGINICVDPMWGNGVGWFPKLLAGGKSKIFEIHNSRNPIFPEMKRPEPIPPNVDAGLKATLDSQSDVLIITDGDADRLGLGDERGIFVDQLRVFGLLAYYLLEVLGLRGPIVKTLSSTSMLNKLGNLYNVPVFETGVGFKYVAPKMLETHAMIGGEESGGYAFHGHVPERDGMVKLNKKPSELVELLFAAVGPHYYDRIDTSFSGNRLDRETAILDAKPKTIGGLKVLSIASTDGYKFSLEDGGWMLIRFSGTEPIIRVYTETTYPEKVKDILNDGLRIARII